MLNTELFILQYFNLDRGIVGRRKCYLINNFFRGKFFLNNKHNYCKCYFMFENTFEYS